MKNTNKNLLGLSMTVLAIGVFGISASSALAYQGDPSKVGPNYTAEKHSALTKAFETKDYNAWKNIMGSQGRVTQLINKDNFSRFVEARALALKGDLAGAQKIRQDLGLGLKNGSSQGSKSGSGKRGGGGCRAN